MVAMLAAGLSEKRAGHERPFLDELVAVLQLEQEDEHVDGDEDVGDVRRRAPHGIVVAERKHLSVLHLSAKLVGAIPPADVNGGA